MKSRLRSVLWAAALLLAASARAADQKTVDVPQAAPAAGPAAPAAALPAASAPSLVPDLGAALSSPDAAAQAAAPAAARPAFGRRPAPAAPPALPAAAVAAAAPAAPSASADAAPTPADAPLIFRAKEEAAKLGVSSFEASPDQALSALRSMRTDGFSIVPEGALVTADDIQALNAEIDSYEAKRPDAITTWALYGNDARGKWDAHPNRVWQPKDGGAARPIIGRLTALLRAALPDEDIELRDANMRIGYTDVDALHVDGGGYITVTITLRGPGTLVYRLERDGRVEEVEAPLGAAAVITNMDRQFLTGIAGTVHSSPTPAHYRGYPADLQRRLLILRYGRAGQAPLTAEDRKKLRLVNDPAIARAQAYRSRRQGGRPAGSKGVLGRLFE